MRAHVTRSLSIDHQTLITVTWERETPEANAPTLEAVFQFNPASTFDLTDLKPGVLVLLSVTRTDTRQPIDLVGEERSEVFQVASDFASEIMP